MKKDEFEEKMITMTKPEINQLRHQDMLARAINRAKDKSALSWWWLIVPFYVILMFIMKSFFMPGATVGSSLHEMIKEQKLVTYILFIISPLVLIIINIFSIRKVYLLSGSQSSTNFLKSVWLNVLMIAFSIVILIIFL